MSFADKFDIAAEYDPEGAPNERQLRTLIRKLLRLKAHFVVVGARGNYLQKVQLKDRNGACAADADIVVLGPDHADWRQFQHRLRKSLAKLQAKLKLAVTATGQQ